MTFEEFAEYKIDNEQFMQDEVICPYCKEEVEVDPEYLYREREDEEEECPTCERKFYLTSEMVWKYTTTPIKAEAEK